MNLAHAVGSLLVTGFAGESLDSLTEKRLRDGERAGLILFRRNVVDSAQLGGLLEAIRSTHDTPPLRAVDQEGGRVRRVGAPCLQLPPMLRLAHEGQEFLHTLGRAVGLELAALGFTLNFAPVLDVHSRDDNPIIGDRAFGTHPEHAAAAALAFGRGLMDGGVDACGKHYPGHGDTDKDSHLELPVVSRSHAELQAVELAPFVSAAKVLPAFMSAHVLYPALDPVHPATLSPSIAQVLLRETLGYSGVLVSDDLEMKALPGGPADHAVAAVLAGCDLLLVCSGDTAVHDAVHQALVHEAERSEALRARIVEASARNATLRRRDNRPDLGALERLAREHAPLQARLDALSTQAGHGNPVGAS